MPKNEHNGRRKSRSEMPKIPSRLGNYLIVTDARETEKNYLLGLRDSIPSNLQQRIVVRVKTGVDTKDIIDVALNLQASSAQYRELWLLFDRDEVSNFDQMISEAEQKGIHVAWSNPCIEIWFSAYFRKMNRCANSVLCCRNFARIFKRKCGTEYKKNDKEIYRKLKKYGDEAHAIRLSATALAEHVKQGNSCPSAQVGASSLHILVSDILERVEGES